MAAILLVEDEQVRVLAESYLEEQGHTGRTITDGMRVRFVPNSAVLEKPYTTEQLMHALTVHFRINRRNRTWVRVRGQYLLLNPA